MKLKLCLSQALTINNRHTISVEGECDKTYGICSIDGVDHDCPYDNIYNVVSIINESCFTFFQFYNLTNSNINCNFSFIDSSYKEIYYFFKRYYIKKNSANYKNTKEYQYS